MKASPLDWPRWSRGTLSERAQRMGTMASGGVRFVRGLALSAWLAGCAGGPTAAAGRMLPESGAELLRAAPAAYSPAAAEPEADALGAAFEGAIRARGPVDLQREATLDCVAAAAAEVYIEAFKAPVRSLRRWIAWRCGWAGVDVRVRVLASRGRVRDERLEGRLPGAAPGLVRDAGPHAYGIARRERGQWTMVAVAVSRRYLEMSPVAKVYPPGATLSLSIRPVRAFTEPALYVDMGGGRTAVQGPQPGPAGTISLQHTLPSAPGRYFVELNAIEPSDQAVDPLHPWHKSVLLFPVYVGVPEPSAPDGFITDPAPNPDRPAMWADRLVAAYNAERARLGLPPLALDPGATALAQKRSEEAARSPRELPPDPAVVDYVHSLGPGRAEFWQSSSESEFLSEYIAERLLSPVIRHRFLAPGASLVGFGVTRRPDVEGDKSPSYSVQECVIARDR